MEQREKAIVFGVHVKGKETDFDYSMEELKGLAAACHLQVVGDIRQKLPRLHQSHYLGSGKLEELRRLVQVTGAQLVICNDELSLSQIRVLEEKLEIKVIDRTMLILDIFAQRARTREAQLQVEVAQLEYMLPRLVGQREHLSRQGGGAGLKNRGAGETKLELDRRKIEEKISALNKELELIEARRKTQRKQRQKGDLPIVSLVGYTNAGKSTVMNALVDLFHPTANKHVFAKDMLFATLETSVRKIQLPNNKSFLLADTVGFINKLPHHLIKAFRSTLEEVVDADLIIHVVDYSAPNYQTLMEVTNKTLDEIGVSDIPVIVAYNKGDLVQADLPRVENDAVYLSAKQRVGIKELIHVISHHIFKDYIHCELLIPYTEGRIIAYLNEHAHVLATDYEVDGTRLVVECSKKDALKFRDYVVKANPDR